MHDIGERRHWHGEIRLGPPWPLDQLRRESSAVQDDEP
jgi:hypothetical protein